jgi:ubiquitin C-terminal hydrolase
MVEFPTFNLDLTTFVTDAEFLNKQGISQKYDLYGIINHYGTLHFGHYISIVKSLND